MHASATLPNTDRFRSTPPAFGATDTLTGLPTRSELEGYLDTCLQGSSLEHGAVGVFYADLDRLRLVNDGFGHATGDELLRRIAERLHALAGPRDYVARFGGDSFVVVCPGIDDQHEAIAIAERIVACAEEPVGTTAGSFTLGISVGVALGGPAESAATLLRDSGSAMHEVKERGGGSYAIFDPAIRGRLLREVELERELRLAISQGEMRLHYQPVVSLATGAVVSFEALARWEHPHRGLLSPAEFIPVAERTGLIVTLGDWALRAACRQIAMWTPHAPGPDWARVAVNVSAVQIGDPRFVSRVRDALADSGVDPARLAIELTETALMESSDTAAAMIAELKQLGVRVVLDDFGTGYSSLGYLARFPVDAIKLDRSFISGTASERSAPIVEAVTGMAHSLGLELVGEGVETVEQRDMLRSIGCDFAQGFHFARPMPGDAVPAWTAAAREAPAPEPLRSGPEAESGSGSGGWLSLGLAASALSVSTSTLRRWADEGKVPSHRTDGGHRRFALRDVHQLSCARNGEPRLRVGPGITAPLPGLAATLSQQAAELIATAGKGLYERLSPGWFATERSQRDLEAWVGALTGAARTGDLGVALRATTTLAIGAESGGATALELALFLERFAVLASTAARGGQGGEERVETQRLFGHVRHQPLRAR